MLWCPVGRKSSKPALSSNNAPQSPVPVDTEFAIADTFEALRPTMRRFSTFAEAEAAAGALEREEAYAAAEAAAAARDARQATLERRARAEGITVDELTAAAARRVANGAFATGGAIVPAPEDNDDDDVDDDDDDSSEEDDDVDDDDECEADDDDNVDESVSAASAPRPPDALALAAAAADEEFERELARAVSESVDGRRQQRSAGLGLSAEHMAIPFTSVARAVAPGSYGTGVNTSVPPAFAISHDTDAAGDGDAMQPACTPEDVVQFTLLKRRSKGGVGLGKVRSLLQ